MSLRTRYRRRAAAGQTQPVFRYPFNTMFFGLWTDDLAWLVGLVWSDGCLFRNTIEVCSKDRDLIERIAVLIGMPNGLRSKNNGKAWRICWTDSGVTDFFRNLGLTPAKSFTAPWPVIPREYQGAFVRGLLDGDGSILLRQTRSGQFAPDLSVSCVGAAPAILTGLTKWLSNRGICYTAAWNRPSLWRVTVFQQESLRRFYDLLYPTRHVSSLQRKRMNYDLWVASPRRSPGRPRNSVSAP
jgi:hypothetical protein